MDLTKGQIWEQALLAIEERRRRHAAGWAVELMARGYTLEEVSRRGGIGASTLRTWIYEARRFHREMVAAERER